MTRALRLRLGVAAAVVIVLVGAAAFITRTGGPKTVTVEALLHDEGLVGERVAVEGRVAPGTRKVSASAVSFRMTDPGPDEGPLPDAPSMPVVRNAKLPEDVAFQDGQQARATGVLGADGVFVAESLSLGPAYGSSAATSAPASGTP